MNPLLQPFDEVDQETIQTAFSLLNAVNFFEKYADIKAKQFIARFESIPHDERLIALERLSALRSELLYMANESASLAEETQDSHRKETQNEESVE
jgi:hypothetical protein